MQTYDLSSSSRKPSSPTLSVFSTVRAPIEERIPLWELQTRTTMLGLRVSSYAKESISSSLVHSSLKTLKLTAIVGNEHLVERSDDLLKENPSDDIAFCLLNKGEAFYYSRQGVTTLHALDAVVYDADTPFLYGFKTDMAQYVFQIPRSQFYRMTGRSSLDEPLFFRNSNTSMLNASRRIFASTIQTLREGKSLNAAQVENVFERVFEHLVAADQHKPDEAYFAAAKAYILSHWHVPDLSVADVAKEVGISERQLARVFFAKDLSVGKFISDVRLENAYKLLTGESSREISIGEISQLAGFRHASQFSRAFKRRFGITPRDARHSSKELPQAR